MIFRRSRDLAQPTPNGPFGWKDGEEPPLEKETETAQQTLQPSKLEDSTEGEQTVVTEKPLKRVRAKEEDGTFRADDKSTVENEAWVEVKVKTENEP
jgi:hypothetical protein